ncbi:hypothetical protein ACHAXM_005864 [Skeletonema potamos]|jgi:calcium release-activated calcium channel protein 1
MIGLAAGIEMADMAWEVKCRDEDMKQRALENERHAIDDARRSVDEKAQQLKVMANQSALIAGFSMIVLVESNIPANINSILLTFFGTITAITIALMLVSTLNSTYILVAILRYDCVERSVPFDVFWRRRCEADWKLALRAFSVGVPSFMIVVALVAWVSFWNHPSVYYSASAVTAISIMLTMFWFANTHRKWGDFLLMSEARILTRGTSFGAESKRSGGSHKDDDSSVDMRESLQLSSLAIGELSESELKLKK